MRLRPLTEAECYARCYGGGWRGEAARFVRVLSTDESARPGTRERPVEDAAPSVRPERLEAA